MVALAFLLLCLCWSTTWQAIRICLVGYPPLSGAAVRFVLAEDPEGRAFRFAPLQGTTYAALGEPKPEDLSTMVLLDGRGLHRQGDAALATEIQAIPGTLTAIPALHAAWGGRIACASGADRKKVDLMLQRVGLWPCFEGRIFSGHEMPRSKPAPDVYLAAAAALGADPRRCLVIEDTPTGVTAGVAAGALVWGYSPPGAGGHGSRQSLRAAGAAEVFTHMGDLPALLGRRPA